MKKSFLALLALVFVIVGCPSGPVDVGVPDASTFAPAATVDAAIDAAAPHRVGSFNPTCTGTGLPHVVSGVQTGACALVSQTADVTGVLPLANGGTNAASGLTTANGVVTSSGTALQQASTVLAGTGFLSIGATPASVGLVRVPYSAAKQVMLSMRNAGNTADIDVVTETAGATTFGDPSASSAGAIFHGGTGGVATLQGYSVSINALSTSIDMETSQYALLLTTTSLRAGQPIIGDTRASAPYSVHGEVTDATVGTFALVAASYAFDIIKLTGGTAGTVTFPLPADDAHAYYKTIINTSGVTKTLTDGGATTQAFLTGFTARFLFDTTGVHLAAASTAYP